jgi:hypothetical protein
MANDLIQSISHNRLTVAFCSVAVFFIATMSIALVIAPGINEARALAERQLEQEVAQESQVACEKWGLAAATAGHVDCVADLAVIRTNHDQRRRADVEY